MIGDQVDRPREDWDKKWPARTIVCFSTRLRGEGLGEAVVSCLLVVRVRLERSALHARLGVTPVGGSVIVALRSAGSSRRCHFRRAELRHGCRVAAQTVIEVIDRGADETRFSVFARDQARRPAIRQFGRAGACQENPAPTSCCPPRSLNSDISNEVIVVLGSAINLTHSLRLATLLSKEKS